MMKRISLILAFLALTSCAYYDALFSPADPQTVQDYRKAVVVSEQTVTGLIKAATTAEHNGLIVQGSLLENAIAKSSKVAVEALNGADKTARAGDLTAASVLYQTAKGAITGLQGNIPGVGQ